MPGCFGSLPSFVFFLRFVEGMSEVLVNLLRDGFLWQWADVLFAFFSLFKIGFCLRQ